jgi:RNA polymerase sigma-70 factor (ECF subfamily)
MSWNNYDTLSSEQLVQYLLSDDREAFNSLYNRHWEGLFKTAHNVLRDEALAKDVVQDIFLDLWRRRHTLQIDTCQAYLAQAVRFQVASQLRKNKLTQTHTEYVQTGYTTNSTEEWMRVQELSQMIETILQKLPGRSRDVFYMSRFEQLSNSEIAKRLNLSTRTVEWHISEALKHLRHAMGDAALALCFAAMTGVLTQ